MEPKANLTSGRLLARNTIWNLGGNAASIIIALISVPVLLRYLGTERLGVISLIWIIEGQFGLFEMGLSYALTKLVSEKLGTSTEHDTPPIFWTALVILVTLGVAGAVALWSLAPWLVSSGLKVPVAIQQETLTAFHFVAFSLPVVISSAALRGLLAAHQRFDLLNITRLPISLASYLAPLLVLPFAQTLEPVVLVLVLSRVMAWGIHFSLCLRVSPVLWQNITMKEAPLRKMLGFGGWMTVTNIVGPIMVNFDRVMIGSVLSMKAVAYYATSFEAATKLWIIPSSLTGVLFPALSATLSGDRSRAALLYEKSVRYIFLCMFPIALGVLSLSRWVLDIWLGGDFAANSTLVLQLLVFGVFANSLAQVPFWHIQAAGRPDLAAKVHLIELPCYLLIFWQLTTLYGITGAGIAWVLRTTADTFIMFWLSGQLMPEIKPICRKTIWMCLLVSPFLLAAIYITNFIVAVIFTIVLSLAFFLVAWLVLLTPQERELAKNPMKFLLNRKSALLNET